MAVESALWDAVKDSTLPIELRAYHNRFPNGRYAAQARARSSDLRPVASGVTPSATPSATFSASAPAPLDERDYQNAMDRRTQELLVSLAVAGVAVTNPPAPRAQKPRSQAITNPFGYTAGDRWRYQTTDRFKGEVVRNWSVQIEKIEPNADLVINKGASIWRANGHLKSSRNAERERFYSHFAQHPRTLQAGSRSKFDYQIAIKFVDGRRHNEISNATMVVKGQEKIKTPAGEFDTWRVELEVYWQTQGTGNRGRYTQVSWCVPQLRRYVAWE